MNDQSMPFALVRMDRSDSVWNRQFHKADTPALDFRKVRFIGVKILAANVVLDKSPKPVDRIWRVVLNLTSDLSVKHYCKGALNFYTFKEVQLNFGNERSTTVK